jgi:hypothetical protein
MYHRAIKIGATLHVFAGMEADRESLDEKVDDLLRSLRPNGDAAIEGDRRIWIEDVPVDAGGDGAERFVWDATGNRCKHMRMRVTATENAITREPVACVYRKLD